MTEQKCKEFFEQVKDRKIRYTSWKNNNKDYKNAYFVPYSFNKSIITGKFFNFGEFQYNSDFHINNGFNTHMGYCWEFIDWRNELSKEFCTCDVLTVLMVTGCQCKGK